MSLFWNPWVLRADSNMLKLLINALKGWLLSEASLLFEMLKWMSSLRGVHALNFWKDFFIYRFFQEVRPVGQLFILSSNKNRSRLAKKWLSYYNYMTRELMPIIYVIIGLLRAISAHNLAKYHHFSMRPSLFDDHHKIAYSLQFSN